jgi:hypothetical protein
MIKTFYLLLLVITLFSVQSLAKGGNPRKGSQRKKEKEEQSESEIDSGVPGALKVGKEGILIPDASSDHPIIISDPKDQPLCKPNTPLTSARPVNVLEGYEAMVLANSIANPKSIFMDQADHLLVVSPEQGLFSVRMDECGNTDIQLILENSQMGQPISNGIAVTGQNLYVSTANSVYKFPYSDGQHSPVSEGKIVVNNINPQDTGAITELAVDPFGYMYVPRSINELSSSMDGSSGVIKRFNLRIVPDQGYDFDNDGEVHAFGTNSHGSMSFDAQARLWGLNGLTGTIKRADISASEGEYNDYNMVVKAK